MAGSPARPLHGLMLDHARVSGMGRGDVETMLAGVTDDAVGLFAEEVLVVPALRLRTVLGGGARQQGAAINRTLGRMAAEALRDPAGAAPSAGRALRFRSKVAYWVWLAGQAAERRGDGGRARTSSARPAAIVPEEALADPPGLVRLVAALAMAGRLDDWTRLLSDAEVAGMEASLARHFGWDVPVHFAELEFTPETWQLPPVEAAPIGGRDLYISEITRTARALLPVVMANGRRAVEELVVDRRETLVLAALVASERPALSAHAMFLRAVAHVVREAVSPSHGVDERQRRQPVAGRDAGPVASLRRVGTAAPDIFSPAPAPDRPSRAAPHPAMVDRSSPAMAAMHPAPPPPPRQASQPEARFASDFAGLLFLLNIFTLLGLYPDFKQPRAQGLSPSPLWLVDRLARLRFGGRYRDDPLAGWIAGQAVPGPLPTHWRAEPDWIAPFPPGGAKVTRADGHVTQWHGAGFPIADAPATDRRRIAPRLLARSAMPAAVRRRLPRRDRWIACLAAYLDARIALATGNVRDTLSLLALPGEIATEPMEMRASFALGHYPVALRMVGLDRDPGWYPAEGRTIRFDFT